MPGFSDTSCSASSMIKSALLKLEQEKSFSDISVSELCKKAGVSRTTFYKCFHNTAEVVNAAIQDMMAEVSLFDHEILGCHDDRKNRPGIPLCEIARKRSEYQPLFYDDAALKIIISRFGEKNEKSFSKRYQMTEEEQKRLKTILYCQLNGCIAMIRSSSDMSEEQWKESRKTVDRFVTAGLKDLFSLQKDDLISVPMGRKEQTVSVPKRSLVSELRMILEPKPQDQIRTVEQSVRNPYGRSLQSIIKPGQKIVIITNDNTRPFPAEIILPVLLCELFSLKVKESDITIVFAIGCHRPLTKQEMIHLVGEQIVSSIRCVNADPEDTVNYGYTERGTPIDITRAAAEADVRICLGNVQYSCLTGYSGGSHALIPGASSLQTIRQNHGGLIRGRVFAGIDAGNPVSEDLEEAVSKTSIDFIIDVVLNSKNEIIHACSGEWKQAHAEAKHYLDSLYRQVIPFEADIVILSAGEGEDGSLYEIIPALENAVNAVRKDGVLILAGECAEGFGNDLLCQWLKQYRQPEKLLSAVGTQFDRGIARAAATAIARRKAEIYLVSSMNPDEIKETMLKPFSLLSNAYESAVRKCGKAAKTIVIHDGNHVMPELKNSR